MQGTVRNININQGRGFVIQAPIIPSINSRGDQRVQNMQDRGPGWEIQTGPAWPIGQIPRHRGTLPFS